MKNKPHSAFLGTVIKNNRLKRYEEYIEYARQNRYDVISLETFFRLPDRRNGNHLVLRHDVDIPGNSTRKMYETEKKVGIRSTYYFRFSTIDKQLIDDMIQDGFDVGLHFETISDYIKETGCSSKEEIDLSLMADRLRADIARFEELTGHKVRSCCSHGAPENVRLGISNNAITENTDVSRWGGH